MQYQAFQNILLEEQTIRNYVVEGIILGYKFKIRYPFFRGTYLSCIEKLEFKIDSETIDPKSICFSLNTKQFIMDELRDQYKEYWNILDEVTITVMKKGGIIKGFHTITVEMLHRIPFIEEQNGYLTISSNLSKTLMAE